MSNCFQHNDKIAKYICSNCNLLICEKCVKSFHAGEFLTYFCPKCNSQCDEFSGSQTAKAGSKNDSNFSIPKKEIKIKEKLSNDVKIQTNETLKKDEKPEEKVDEITEELDTDADDLSDLYSDSENSELDDLLFLDLNGKKTNVNKIEETIPYKQGSLIAFPFKCLLNPGKAFENSLKDLNFGIAYKVKCLFLNIFILALIIFLKAYNGSLLYGMSHSVVSLFIFSFIFVMGIKISGNVKSILILILQVSTMWLFIQLFQNLTMVLFTGSFQQLFLNVFAACFILIQLWVFVVGISRTYEISPLNVFFIYLISASLIDPILYFIL